MGFASPHRLTVMPSADALAASLGDWRVEWHPGSSSRAAKRSPGQLPQRRHAQLCVTWAFAPPDAVRPSLLPSCHPRAGSIRAERGPMMAPTPFTGPHPTRWRQLQPTAASESNGTQRLAFVECGSWAFRCGKMLAPAPPRCTAPLLPCHRWVDRRRESATGEDAVSELFASWWGGRMCVRLIEKPHGRCALTSALLAHSGGVRGGGYQNSCDTGKS